MEGSEPYTPIFEPPEDIADQHVTPLPMTCFERLDSLMAEGKGSDWTEYIRRGSPATGGGYWAWDRLTYIQRHVKDAPQAPDFTGQTIHLLYKGDAFEIAVKGASRMVDKICQGENGGEEAKKVEGDVRKYLIPACVAIIKAVFERSGGPEEGPGSFTKVTLEVIMRALDWVYKLVAVTGDGDGWKEGLGEALEPLAGNVLVAMRCIREMEAANEEDTEESKDGDEMVEEEKGRGEATDRDDGLEEVESTAEKGDVKEGNGEESDEPESAGEPSGGEESDGDEAESVGELSGGKESDMDGSIGNKSDEDDGIYQVRNAWDKGGEADANNFEDESMEEAEHIEEDESMEEAERMEEDESMGGVVCTVEKPLEEEHLEAYSRSGYEPGLESDSDYSVTTAQATRRNGRRTRRQTANLSSRDEDVDDAIQRVETHASRKRRADADEYDSPPPPKRLCRRGTPPRTPTDSEELTGPKTRLRRGSFSRVEEPRRSARVKKLQEPQKPQKPKKDGPRKDGGKLGIPHWVEAPLYTTVYNGIGNGERVPASNRLGILVRDGLGFFASKEERLRQG